MALHDGATEFYVQAMIWCFEVANGVGAGGECTRPLSVTRRLPGLPPRHEAVY